jgi:hypothetical protein
MRVNSISKWDRRHKRKSRNLSSIEHVGTVTEGHFRGGALRAGHPSIQKIKPKKMKKDEKQQKTEQAGALYLLVYLCTSRESKEST